MSPDYCVSGSKELETCEFSCPIFSTMARLHLFVVLVRVLSHMSNNNHSQTGLFTVLHLLCSAASPVYVRDAITHRRQLFSGEKPDVRRLK